MLLLFHLNLSKLPYHDLFSNIITVGYRDLLAVCLLLYDFILRFSDKTWKVWKSSTNFQESSCSMDIAILENK